MVFDTSRITNDPVISQLELSWRWSINRSTLYTTTHRTGTPTSMEYAIFDYLLRTPAIMFDRKLPSNNYGEDLLRRSWTSRKIYEMFFAIIVPFSPSSTLIFLILYTIISSFQSWTCSIINLIEKSFLLK